MITKHTSPIPPDYDQTRVIERPDGFYWQDEELADKFFGPFPTLLEAVLDMQLQGDSDSDTDFEEGESLEDAEAEIGISNWIDPETGEPAEGSSTRLNDD
ncbi:MAG: hypothetical protein ACOY9D_08130 [Pseudomonadota bacterium]